MDAVGSQKTGHDRSASQEIDPTQLDVISATTAEEREFNELRRDLPRATDIEAATEILFKHVRRVMPAATLALYLPKPDTNEIHVVACCGIGSSTIGGLRVAIGDHISGWAFAHAQVVINSDAALELGPVARTLSVPLRYAAAVPIVDGRVVAVIMTYSTEPFQKDHRRLLENAATLFVSAISQPLSPEKRDQAQGRPSEQARVH